MHHQGFHEAAGYGFGRSALLSCYSRAFACCRPQGAVPGSKKRVITLRRSIFPQTSRNALEEIKCGSSYAPVFEAV